MENNNIFAEIEKKLNEIINNKPVNELCYFHKEQISCIHEQIMEVQAELKFAKEKANESKKLKTAFLQSITHEVRTPMNAIVGFSQLLTKNNISQEKILQYTNIINTNSYKLLELITDFIDISQINAQITQLQNTEFDLTKLLTELCSEFKHKSNTKNLEFEFNLTCETEQHIILSDKPKLEKIFRHSLENAIKFTENGKIVFDCQLNTSFVKFQIKDSGIGISDEMQEIIFEPFRQIDNGFSRIYGGAGLGLSIVKSFIELLKGQITLKSEINKGTEFTIIIPTQKMNSENYFNELQNNNLKTKTILVVDDEPFNLEFINELLSETQAKILNASNGQQAVDICRNQTKIDLILMDIKMPIMDGHTATKLIKAFRPDFKIIAQTAFAMEFDKIKIVENGFDDFLTKPISDTKLFELLNKYLR